MFADSSVTLVEHITNLLLLNLKGVIQKQVQLVT